MIKKCMAKILNKDKAKDLGLITKGLEKNI